MVYGKGTVLGTKTGTRGSERNGEKKHTFKKGQDGLVTKQTMKTQKGAEESGQKDWGQFREPSGGSGGGSNSLKMGGEQSTGRVKKRRRGVAENGWKTNFSTSKEEFKLTWFGEQKRGGIVGEVWE